MVDGRQFVEMQPDRSVVSMSALVCRDRTRLNKLALVQFFFESSSIPTVTNRHALQCCASSFLWSNSIRLWARVIIKMVGSIYFLSTYTRCFKVSQRRYIFFKR